MNALHEPLTDGDLTLEPLAPAHREGLRAACAADSAIWDIYPKSWAPEHFDTQFDALLASNRLPFAIVHGGEVVGMTAYIGVDPERAVLEIGNSFIRPDRRGTGLNGRIKRLMLDRAFAKGVRRAEFRVDARNGRSQAAVLKLGAVREGVMRAERVTWNGHVRDTVLFSILDHEWNGGRSAAVQP